jgi:beta-glucosidase
LPTQEVRSIVRRITSIVVAVAAFATAACGGGAVAAPECKSGAVAQTHAADPVARARAIVNRLTLTGKIAEMHGIEDSTHVRFVPGIACAGIPPLVITNGPAGVAHGDTKTESPATALPAPEALAATWDPTQAARYGRIMGTEAVDVGNNFLEGTYVNIVRVPQNGRAFETYGEDPYLVSQMAVANITAAQSAGIIDEVKTFDAYSQEAHRRVLDQSIDERTLHEIYDPPFEAAIQQGGTGAVMCAYPAVNGTFSCENRGLLTSTLRDSWGFQGFVTSDFGAVHSTVSSVNAGMNLEMPTGIYYGTALETAVNDGQLKVSAIDNLLVQRFAGMIRMGLFDHPVAKKPIPAGADGAVSKSIAEQGAVLLKNHDVGTTPALPLNPAALHSIALIGPYATAPKTGGGGSSQVDPLFTVDPATGIRNEVPATTKVAVDPGTDVTAAANLAARSDVAIVMVGDDETEGHDRHNLSLLGDQDALVRAVAAANPKTIVVVKSGGPVLMPWVNEVPAILEAWYPGEEDGAVVADLLFGRANPSGKLPLTFPARESDVPANTPAQWPGVEKTGIADVRYGVTYSEGVFVGYRHYDAAHIAPLFPFGFGLSYTTFAFSHPTVQAGANGTFRVTADITNTGQRPGSDTAQLYVGDPSTPAVPEPPNQLEGFEKVPLSAGQTKQIAFTLPRQAFSYWDTARAAWRVAGGTYRINVGDSSRSLPLTATVTLPAG